MFSCLAFFPLMCVHAVCCVYVCIYDLWCICVVLVYVCIQIHMLMYTCRCQRRTLGVLPYHFPPYVPWAPETGFLTEFEAMLVAKKPQWSSCLHTPRWWGYRCVWPCLTFYVGSVDLNPGPHACITSVLTHGAISPGPFSEKKNYPITSFVYFSIYYWRKGQFHFFLKRKNIKIFH